jgi:hypothetical protein
MITFSYRTARRILKILPICPKVKAIGLENIPKNGPIIFAHNHITQRTENIFLGLAVPAKSDIRFLGDITLMDPKYLPILKRDLANSILSERIQNKFKKSRFKKIFYTKLIDYLARYLIAQINRFGSIGLDLYPPTSEQDKLEKLRINKRAWEKCMESLEDDISLAIAPSGGKTSETVEEPVYYTVIPTLAAWLYRRGKIVKIVPSIVKERPLVSKNTYWPQYVADRIFIIKVKRRILNLFKKRIYIKPRLTVEFLSPITFENAEPTKLQRIGFVKNLQQMIYNKLKDE